MYKKVEDFAFELYYDRIEVCFFTKSVSSPKAICVFHDSCTLESSRNSHTNFSLLRTWVNDQDIRWLVLNFIPRGSFLLWRMQGSDWLFFKLLPPSFLPSPPPSNHTKPPTCGVLSLLTWTWGNTVLTLGLYVHVSSCRWRNRPDPVQGCCCCWADIYQIFIFVFLHHHAPLTGHIFKTFLHSRLPGCWEGVKMVSVVRSNQTWFA